MATAPSTPANGKNGYPTSDGRAFDSDWHRNLTATLIEILKDWYMEQSNVYVSGNLLLCYEEGNRRKRTSPDVFVVKGVAKHDRPNYLLWQEGKGPDVVIELTSSSTRREDERDKFQLYQDVLRVKEYFLFDLLGHYLQPPLQGYRLRRGHYHPIRSVAGRLPSQVLQLHLERNDRALRLYDPTTKRWLPTRMEKIEIAKVRRQAETLRLLEVENERLRCEVAELRRRSPKSPPLS